MTKTALITGAGGQDGAYLSQLLLEKGYRVHGTTRRTTSIVSWRLKELGIQSEVEFHNFDLYEQNNINRVLDAVKPDEIYNLAAQSFVGVSFEQPMYTAQIDGLGVTRLLESVRQINPDIRFYQASTSEMFGKIQETPQSETTQFYPRSPYATAKLYAHWMTVNYRESYDMHASSGILFNHESPLRGEEFVTRKITYHLAQVKHGLRDVLRLGNIDVTRDWGFAKDYVEGMHLMLQQEHADDYILATGRTESVRFFVNTAAHALGFDLEWTGSGIDEKGIDTHTGKVIVEIDPKFFRLAEVDLVVGDASKAQRKLGWTATTSLEDLVTMMAESDELRVKSGSD